MVGLWYISSMVNNTTKEDKMKNTIKINKNTISIKCDSNYQGSFVGVEYYAKDDVYRRTVTENELKNIVNRNDAKELAETAELIRYDHQPAIRKGYVIQ